MLIKNISAKQFSLEGIIIEAGETREIENSKAELFLSLYAGTGVLEKVGEIEKVEEKAEPQELAEPLPKGVPIEEVIKELEPKVRKPRTKKA